MEPKTTDYWLVRGGYDFDYEVCYRPKSVGTWTDSIYLYLQREYPSGGLDYYRIDKPITLTAVEPAIDSAMLQPPKPKLPPLEDPTTFRNILMPSSETLEQGEIFYGNYMIAGNLAGYGVTDKLTVMAGGIFVPDFIQRLYLGTVGVKYEVLRTGDLAAAVGGNYALSSAVDSDISTIAPYVVGTFGDVHRQITVGLGYGFKRHVTPLETFDRNALTLAVGGNLTFTRGWKITAEVYSIESSGVAPMIVTFRKFTEKFALDFGLGVDLNKGSDVLFNDFLSGEVKELSIAPVLSGMWVF